ncbi:unnamed protein product, partial [Mesorhabditis belari]|uniref:Protein kinase domain-containing protein n=1 Tax=Mesorhabditis belari TaxID=2138241 RepID=A0AAF3EHP1_9BILA
MKSIFEHLWKFIFIPIFAVSWNLFGDSSSSSLQMSFAQLSVSMLIYFLWLDEWMVWLQIQLRDARINATVPEIPFKAVENCVCPRNLLGSGAYANVYRVDTMNQEHPMVLKLLRVGEDQSIEDIERNIENEIKLRKMKHRLLVKYLGCVKKNNNGVLQSVGILMKFVERKSLKELIFSSKYSYSMYTVACWMEQLFSALTYLQKQQIIHRDIKPDNILVDDFYYLILADFGNAKLDVDLGTDGDISGSYVGTYRYKSPEASPNFADGGQRMSYRSDVYSTGIVIWEMIERRKIFMMKYVYKQEEEEERRKEEGGGGRKEEEEEEGKKEEEEEGRRKKEEEKQRFDQMAFYDDMRSSKNALDLDPLDAPQNFIELVICCTIFNMKARLNASEALDYSTTIKKTYETSDVLWEFFPKETNHVENSPIIKPKEIKWITREEQHKVFTKN